MSDETQSAETFSIQEDFGIIRESDGEVMANYDADKDELAFTHHSREKNYGEEIRGLVDKFKAAQTEGGEFPPLNPVKESMTQPDPTHQAPNKREERGEIIVPEDEPEKHPQFGSYSRDHLLYDNAKMKDADFAKKWGGPMLLSTTRTIEGQPQLFGEIGIEIINRLSK